MAFKARKKERLSQDMKKRAGINELGKENYEFDCFCEMNIYSYLCRKRLSKRKINQIEKNLRFETYSEWKKYVKKKYEKLPDGELREFSHYLNQQLREVKPTHESWSLTAAVMITFITNNMYDQIISITLVDDKPPLVIGLGVILSLITICIGMYFILQFILKIGWMSDKENFYTDYKEIIDMMIEERYGLAKENV